MNGLEAALLIVWILAAVVVRHRLYATTYTPDESLEVERDWQMATSAREIALRERLNPYVKDEYRIMFDEGWFDRGELWSPRWPNSTPYMRGWDARGKSY